MAWNWLVKFNFALPNTILIPFPHPNYYLVRERYLQLMVRESLGTIECAVMGYLWSERTEKRLFLHSHGKVGRYLDME